MYPFSGGFLRNTSQAWAYAVLTGGANGDLDLLEFMDGRSYKLQCRSHSRTREFEACMCEGRLTQRS